MGSRRARRAIAYQALEPDRVAELDAPLLASTAAAAATAEAACRELDAAAARPAGLEALARLVLRSESVASSHIEGLVLSHRRLARAAYSGARDDLTAQHVLGNLHAMEQAVERGRSERAVTTQLLLDIHRTLFEGTPDARLGGTLRVEQNWIGGGGSSPAGADFVPPPEDLVPGLLDDLCAFCNRRDVPAIVQAAVAHAQFETIHPFVDGNGRVGRALVHVLLVRSGLATRRIPPVSLALAGDAAGYVRGLGDFRFGDRNAWYLLFARAVDRASRESLALGAAVSDLQARWRASAGHPRADSAASRLIERLPETPIVDLGNACRLVGASDEAVRLALQRLEAAGVMRQLSAGRRNRAFECVGLFDLLDRFERRLGEPSRSPKPTRKR